MASRLSDDSEMKIGKKYTTLRPENFTPRRNLAFYL